jgi:hypothetical protein
MPADMKSVGTKQASENSVSSRAPDPDLAPDPFSYAAADED